MSNVNNSEGVVLPSKKVSAEAVWFLSILLSIIIFGIGAYFIKNGNFAENKGKISGDSEFLKELDKESPDFGS